MRRVLAASLLAAAILPLLGTLALADSEWCDTGSPPPNDFRLQRTGTGSFGSATGWLRSTTGGSLTFQPYSNSLVGGVARGMEEALTHRGSDHPGSD